MAIVSAKYQDINFPLTSEMKLWSDEMSMKRTIL